MQNPDGRRSQTWGQQDWRRHVGADGFVPTEHMLLRCSPTVSATIDVLDHAHHLCSAAAGHDASRLPSWACRTPPAAERPRWRGLCGALCKVALASQPFLAGAGTAVPMARTCRHVLCARIL